MEKIKCPKCNGGQISVTQSIVTDIFYYLSYEKLEHPFISEENIIPIHISLECLSCSFKWIPVGNELKKVNDMIKKVNIFLIDVVVNEPYIKIKNKGYTEYRERK